MNWNGTVLNYHVAMNMWTYFSNIKIGIYIYQKHKWLDSKKYFSII